VKILISAGIKTENIVKGINEKFNSGGVDFVVVPFIEDIDSIYQRGEYFDKAILLEQSWNHDFEDSDEISVRTRINNFARQSAYRELENASFIFLAQDKETAAMVYEEIVDIQTNSAVLIRKPRYSVLFFGTLITTEIDKLQKDLVYKPEIKEEIKVEKVETTPEVKEYNPDYTPFDLDKELLGGNNWDGNGNGLDINSGIEEAQEPEQPVEDSPFADIGSDFQGFEQFPQTEEDPGIEVEATDDWPGQSGDIGQGEFDPSIGEDMDWQMPQQGEQQFEQAGFNEEPVQQPFVNIEKEPETPMDMSGDLPDYTQDPMNSEYTPEYQSEEQPGFEQPPYEQAPYEEPQVVQPETPVNNEFDTGMYATPEVPQQPDYQEDYNPDYDQYNAPRTSGYQTPDFTDNDYDRESDIPSPVTKNFNRVDLSNSQIKATLDAFANRGNSILVTGCGGCGTSVVALNLANVINNLGYTVLLVDLDTKNKAQSYISKDNYECIEPDSAGLMAAINSTSGINAHISIVRQGFHLLTMGISTDSAPIEKLLHKEKITRFMNLAKTSHNFIIYDTPFDTAVGFGSDFTFMADNIVVTVDCSNWGITKTMIGMTNIESDDMQETMFNKGQLLFNKYRAINRVMGRKVKTAMDITKVMDYKVRELLGEDPGFYFQSMHICGLINDDPKFEAGWFESTQYSDTKEGSQIFLELLKNIVLKR
jgi:cellulose biosynthesis protein BcsQ